MTDIPDRWSRVAGLFDQAQQRPRADRAAFLDAACQDDRELKAEVQALLDADDRAAGFLADPATAVGPLLLGDAVPSIPAGAMFGPYRIERTLGQGGMGQVYLAEDTRLGRLVTLKILHARDTGDDKRRERLCFEARAAASLVHPNIATVHALEDLSGQLCIVSEYVAGRTAREVLDTTGPLAVEEAVEVTLQIARGLDAAHRHGIIHRDLKPENILIGDSRSVRILDFGVARTLTPDQPAKRLTDTGVMVGTPGYMAPEQLEGGAGDVRSDLFAFGTVMYELVTGRNPFQGHTVSSTAARILTAEPEPLCRVNPLVPPGLEAIVSRCLKKDPAERYAGAAEVAVDLESLARELAIRPPATRSAGADAAAEEPGHDSPALALWRAHQGIILGLLTGLLIGSWWLAAWLGTPWRFAFFAVVLALTVADGTIRVHLLFVEHEAPASIRVQLARTQHWRRALDLLVALIVAPAAAQVLGAHEIAGILMLGVSAGIGAATWVIEPTTTEAAFPRWKEQRPS
jgi:predicted Ser/Thr protein kinase